ncbi:MAG: ribonucleoside-triphosphate reductase, partial [Bacteroidales bacterium]|nr:ribonucleoside-triphosphate reductase [Bacteroidales bacterium]
KKNDFIRDYIKASNAATGSKFDANANVTSKNIVTLGHELYKENNIKQNRYIMQDKIRALYGRGMAQQYIDDLESHVLYKHDESGTPGYPYCVAITMYPFLVSGLRELGGVSIAPTDLKSFCGEFINLVYSISSQFMGAVATPEFLMYLDYFIRKDYGDDYLDRLDDVVENNVKKRTLRKVIDNCFQQVVHSMNMPAGNRGYQTVFWNVGYFDKPYFEGVFSDFRFPDGTAPKWETLSWLQKHFMNWFNEERNHYILTFPVETMALLTDGGDDYADKEYADFTAEMWAKGHSFFCYISNSPDSLSSCCRLRNSLKDLDDGHNHTTHQYSMGTASVATGSKSVMTLNLNRLIQDAARKYYKQEKGLVMPKGEALQRKSYDKDKMYEYIKEAVTEHTVRVHKYQTAFNEIIKDFLKADMLDVYRAGFIDMRKQYLTVGVNGLTDAAEFLGLEISPNDDYKEFVNTLLETINVANRKDRTPDCMFNTEFVPGENLSGKNYKWDKKDGYFVSPKHNMYSSYFYNPEDESLSMIDKFKLHGEEYVKYLDGGSALHMNISEHLSKEQYRQLLNTAAHYGTNYFTFNCRNTVCNDCGYISKDTLEVCPKCGSRNLDYLTRVIGYLKRVSSFSEMRQEEAHHRYYTDK